MTRFQLFDFCDDVLSVRESLTLQLGEDQSSVQHHFKGRPTTHLSSDEGGGIRAEDLISEFLITRPVASGAAVFHIDLNHELSIARHGLSVFVMLNVSERQQNFKQIETTQL